MARYTSKALVRERMKSMGTGVIADTETAGTLDMDTAIDRAESYVIARLPERYRQLALGNVHGEIVVWAAESTTTSFTVSFYPMHATANYFLYKNPGQAVEFNVNRMIDEDNDSILTSGSDYTVTLATGVVTGLTLSRGDRLVMSYKYSTWTLFTPGTPTTYYNVPAELTRICTDASVYYAMLDLYQIGRQDFLLNSDNLAIVKDGLDSALKDLNKGDMSFYEYDDVEFYEDWPSGDPEKGGRTHSLEWGRG